MSLASRVSDLASRMAAEVKATRTTAANAANLTSGTIPDGRFPVRLQPLQVNGALSDANNAFDSGFHYIANNSAGNNPPGTTDCSIFTTAPNAQYLTQVGFGFNQSTQWIRHRVNGTFTAWRALVVGDDARLSDARTPVAHTHVIGDLPVAGSGVSSTVALVRADDARLSDSRAPTGHSHTLADLPVASSGTSSASQLVRADDARLSDSRNPTAHNHNTLYPPLARAIATTGGLTGGGDLSADRSLSVDFAADGGTDTNKPPKANDSRFNNANLAALRGLSGAADTVAYFTAAGTMALTTLTSWARPLLADANAGEARSYLDVYSKSEASAIGVGAEVRSIERTSNFTTTNTTANTASAGIIDNFSFTWVGEGRAYDLIFTTIAQHTVASAKFGSYIVVNGNATSPTAAGAGFLAVTQLGAANAGVTHQMRRRVFLSSGVSYTFTIGIYGNTSGTAQCGANTSIPIELSLIRR